MTVYDDISDYAYKKFTINDGDLLSLFLAKLQQHHEEIHLAKQRGYLLKHDDGSWPLHFKHHWFVSLLKCGSPSLLISIEEQSNLFAFPLHTSDTENPGEV